MLCTIYLHCAPSTCIVHHGAQGGPMSVRSAPPSKYRTTLCTIDLCCVPPTYIVHHGAQEGPMSVRSGSRPRHFSFVHNEHIHVVHKGVVEYQGSQCSSVLTYTFPSGPNGLKPGFKTSFLRMKLEKKV